MQFSLFGVDLFPKDNLYGVWVGGYKNYDDVNRHLFMIYWNDGELLVEVGWMRLFTTAC